MLLNLHMSEIFVHKGDSFRLPSKSVEKLTE